MTPDPPRVERSPFDDWTPGRSVPEPARTEVSLDARVAGAADPGRGGLAAAGRADRVRWSRIVSAANRPPVAGARPELTWTTDQALAPELAAATGDLGALSDDVDAFGEIGRGRPHEAVDRDTAGLQKTIAAGEAQLARHRRSDREAPGAAGGHSGDVGPTDAGLTSLRVRYDRLTSGALVGDRRPGRPGRR